MIALVEFDKAIQKDVYEKLKGIYDFGEVTDRVYNNYNDEPEAMQEGVYFRDEVELIGEGEDKHYALKSNHDETVESWCIKERVKGDWIGITERKHIVDLKELYTACRKAQVKILEVARID